MRWNIRGGLLDASVVACVSDLQQSVRGRPGGEGHSDVGGGAFPSSGAPELPGLADGGDAGEPPDRDGVPADVRELQRVVGAAGRAFASAEAEPDPEAGGRGGRWGGRRSGGGGRRPALAAE